MNTTKLRPNVQKALDQMKKSNTDEEPLLRNVKSIKFGILSPEEIEDISVCKVYKSKISSPLEDTVYDERMGPCDSNGLCTTCGASIRVCPGHFGHIELAVPVIHPQFSKLLVSILNCICLSCSKLKTEKRVIDMVVGEQSDRIVAYTDRLKSVETFCSKIATCFEILSGCSMSSQDRP